MRRELQPSPRTIGRASLHGIGSVDIALFPVQTAGLIQLERMISIPPFSCRRFYLKEHNWREKTYGTDVFAPAFRSAILILIRSRPMRR